MADREDEKDDEKAMVEKPDTKTQRQILYIQFKWNRSQMKEKKNCDTKHMLYLLHLALEKVSERTDERNEQFKNYGRNDRILKHPDYTQIITNFIDWHLLDPDANKFDGHYLESIPRLQCTNLLKTVGAVKEGWAIKIYKYLKKDINVDMKWKVVQIPNYKHESIGKSLATSSVEDMINILQKYVFVECVKKAKNKGWKLEAYKDDILAHFTKEKLDGAKFSVMKRKEFKDQLRVALGNDKSLNGPLIKMFTVIEKCNVNDVLK